MLKRDSGTGGTKKMRKVSKPPKKTPPKTAKTISKTGGRGGPGKRGNPPKPAGVKAKKAGGVKANTASKKAARTAVDSVFKLASKTTPAPKTSSDWDKGAGWMDGVINGKTGKSISKKGGTKGKWWNPFD